MSPGPLRALVFVTLAALSISVVDVREAVADCQCLIFDPCHVNHHCVGDICVSEPRNCATGDPCHPGRCDTSIGCVQDTFCPEDGLCNGIRYCQVIHTPIPIPVCVTTPPADCSDNDACTYNEQCVEGVGCTHDTLSCNDLDPCTTDSCSPAVGCTYEPIAGCCQFDYQCARGDQCVTRACVGSRCVEVGPRDCDDVDTCTTDSCSPATGCVHKRVAGCGTPEQPPACRKDDDCASPCTTGRTCTDGECSDGTPTTCDDGDPCTIDSCDPATGCVAAPRTGFDVLACVCERPQPRSCDGDSVPKAITKRLTGGCSAVSRAASASGRKRTKLISKAAKQFQAASKQATRIAGHKVSADCGNALAAGFADNRTRAITVRGQP